MVAKVKIAHNELVLEKEVKFPSHSSASHFIAYLEGTMWHATELVLSDDEEFGFVPDNGSEVGPLLLSPQFNWQLKSDTPSHGQVKLSDTGDWELWLL